MGIWAVPLPEPSSTICGMEIWNAKTAWYVDGDKIRQYPEVEKFVIEHLGCRIHGVIGCDYWLCKEK